MNKMVLHSIQFKWHFVVGSTVLGMEDPFSSSEKKLELESIVSPIKPHGEENSILSDDEDSDDSVLNRVARKP